MTGVTIVTAMVRGLHLAATLSLLGTVGFIAWMLPAATVVPPVSVIPNVLQHWLTRLWRISGLIALLAGMAWFGLQAVVIAGAGTVSDGLDALPLVARHTRFGNILMVRLGLLLLATLLAISGSKVTVSRPSQRCSRMPVQQQAGPGPRDADVDATVGIAKPRLATSRLSALRCYLALVLLFVAVGLQGMIGHAGAAAGATGHGLVFSEGLHLLAAGIWLGALLPLWLSLRMLILAHSTAICGRFSSIGLACVLVLAGTGFAQALELIGGLPNLFGTPYGHIALLKIALFLLALLLATLNRLWLTDRLAAAAADARNHLLLSVSLETCAGLAIVMAAAFMATSVPAVHTIPVWPFSWQFSLVTVNEDPDLRQQVVVSLMAIGVAVALMVTAMLTRRLRAEALCILMLAVVFRGPSLVSLTTEAYPTSFQTSPTLFSAASIAYGQMLFGPNCSACHGSGGKGDGPEASSLAIKPADLTLPHIRDHTDGEMFWWLSHGIDDPGAAPAAGLGMPGFGHTLSAEALWALIDYVRAHEAGVAAQQQATFEMPIRAPALAVSCAGLDASSMSDLRGHVVHVVTGHAVAATMLQDQGLAPSGISTVTLDLRDAAPPEPGSCVAVEPAGLQAYAVLANWPSDKLDGTEFLVDPDGWLRAVHLRDRPGGWSTKDSLSDAIRRIRATSIQQPNGVQHDHH